jgi:hypothetical protein
MENSQWSQLLGLTADNASPNDVMVNELVDMIPAFGGQANRVRCFDHVVNLVAKAILKLFEGGRAVQINVDVDGGDDDEELDNDDENVDNEEGLVDPSAALSEDERLELEEAIMPVKVVLVKVGATKKDQ